MHKNVIRAALQRTRELRTDERGAVGLYLAIVLTPLMFFAGAALDYSGASLLKTDLERATDGTVIRLCQVPGTPTAAELKLLASPMMTSLMGSQSYAIDDVVLSSGPRRIKLNTSRCLSPARSSTRSTRRSLKYPSQPLQPALVRRSP